MFLTRLLRAADHPYLFGKGGRTMNNGACQGMTVASLKHHVALQPLFVIMGVGIVFVCAYIGRLVYIKHHSSFSKFSVAKLILESPPSFSSFEFAIFNFVV